MYILQTVRPLEDCEDCNCTNKINFNRRSFCSRSGACEWNTQDNCMCPRELKVTLERCMYVGVGVGCLCVCVCVCVCVCKWGMGGAARGTAATQDRSEEQGWFNCEREGCKTLLRGRKVSNTSHEKHFNDDRLGLGHVLFTPAIYLSASTLAAFVVLHFPYYF
jgi:hypothetical protein